MTQILLMIPIDSEAGQNKDLMDLQINLRYVTAHVILGFFLEFYKYLEIFSVWHNWRDGVEYFDQLEFAWIFVCWSIRFSKTKIIKCIIFALRINKNYVEVAFYVLKCVFFSGLSWWSPEIWPIIDNWLSFCWNKIQCNGNRKVGIWARKKEILTEIWNQTLLCLNKVEPTTFARAKLSQNGSNLDLLELSWSKKLKSDIVRAEVSLRLTT